MDVLHGLLLGVVVINVVALEAGDQFINVKVHKLLGHGQERKEELVKLQVPLIE